MRLVYGLLLSLLLVAQAEATTFYVSLTTNSPPGNDANTCTQAQSTSTPKATFASAVTCLTPGDTLQIRAGTYTEKLVSGSGGIPGGTSWAVPVTLSAYPGETVTIASNEATWPCLYTSGTKSYIIFSGLVFDGVNLDSSQSVIFIDDTSHHIRIQDSEVKRGPTNGIYIAYAPYNIEILRNVVHDNGTTNLGHGIYVQGDTNTIDGNEFYSNAKFGVQVYGDAGSPDNNIVRNNKVHNNSVAAGAWGEIVLSSGNANLAYNNLVYGSPDGNGIIVGFNTTTNTEVYNNTVYNNALTGIRIDPTAPVPTGTIVKNNIFYQNGTNYENYGTGTVENNNLRDGTNPQFVDAAGGNFRLRYDSPALDYGVTLAGVPTDYLSTARPQGGAYDAGAYEEWNVKNMARRR